MKQHNQYSDRYRDARIAFQLSSSTVALKQPANLFFRQLKQVSVWKSKTCLKKNMSFHRIVKSFGLQTAGLSIHMEIVLDGHLEIIESSFVLIM